MKSHKSPPVPDISRALKRAAAPQVSQAPAVSDEPCGCHVWAGISISTPCGLHQDGVVLELSERHAHLRFVSRAHVPDEIQLNIPRLSLHVPARVMRQDGNDLFVEFDTPLDNPCGHLGN